MTRPAIPARHVPPIIRAVLKAGFWASIRERGHVEIEIHRPTRLAPVFYSVTCRMETIEGQTRGIHDAVDEINRIVSSLATNVGKRKETRHA